MGTVSAVGPRNARIALVGEAPGEQEALAGRPFQGPAGKVLEAALRQVGLRREECFITNVVTERPPRNDFGVFYADRQRHVPTEELLAERARLWRELLEVRPNVTVLLGTEAMKAVLGKDGVLERRGSVEMAEGAGGALKVMSAIHPAAILRDPKSAFYPLLVFDLTRAKREMHSPAVNNLRRTLRCMPPVEEAVSHLVRMRQARAPVAFDIETEYGGAEWLSVAFSDAADWALCVPTSMRWGVSQAYVDMVRPYVDALLTDPMVPKVAQNAQFDCLFLQEHYGIRVWPVCFDTMTAHHTVYPELPKSLAVLTSIYTDQPYYKDMAKNPPDLWEYNALDAAVTFECFRAIDAELRELGVHEFYHTQVLPLMWPLMEMQRTGVSVDVANREAVAAQLQQELDDLQAQMNQAAFGWTLLQETRVGKNGKRLAGEHQVGLSAQSPKQLQEFLFEKLRLPRTYKRATGTVTTDEEALKRLAKKSPHPVLQCVLDIRERQKLLSTYVLASLGADQRLHCSYVVGGTETGRLASRASIFGNGTNLQNVPKGVARRLIVPSKAGNVFVETDLSQAEARIVAYLAKDERLIEVFNRGGDIHKENAAHLFHEGDVSRVTKTEREVAKRLVHAANYGIGPKKFQETLAEKMPGITQKEAERYLQLYHARFPKIKRWHDEVEAKLKKGRVLRTPMGRRRQFFGRWGDELLREAYAYVPQSTVADVLNRGLVEVAQTLVTVDREAVIRLTVHDSIVVECRESHKKPVGRHLRKTLEVPIVVEGQECVIPADLKWGWNWNDMEVLDV